MKKKHKRGSIMNRSDIPFAKRMAMQHNNNIVENRNIAAQRIMFCICIALHELEGIGYKRLVRYSLSFKNLIDEVYEDVEVGMAHAKQRLQQHGIEISGDLYCVKRPGASAKQQQIYDHSIQAAQIAQIVGTITLNEEFGFGESRLKKVLDKVRELSAKYAKEGDAFLIAEMQKLGFPVVNGKITAFIDEEGKPVAVGRALKEGYVMESGN